MESEEHMLRRSELYALVWEKAVQRVALDIGVSGVAVAKACRKHRFLEQQARLWHRRRQVLEYVEAVRAHLKDADVSPKECATAEGWLDWADEYLRRRNPLGLLLWNPLITREDRLYYTYAWHGMYGEMDEWLETWRG